MPERLTFSIGLALSKVDPQFLSFSDMDTTGEVGEIKKDMKILTKAAYLRVLKSPGIFERGSILVDPKVGTWWNSRLKGVNGAASTVSASTVDAASASRSVASIVELPGNCNNEAPFQYNASLNRWEEHFVKAPQPDTARFLDRWQNPRSRIWSSVVCILIQPSRRFDHP
jgi:hypothetical protein